MKKKLLTLVSALMLGIMLLTVLCGCSTYGKVLKAFEKDGWSEVESLQSAQDKIVEEALGEDAKSVCKIHALGKDGSLLNYVIILEFDSTKEIEEEIEKSETLKGMIKDVQNSDYVSGTCVLLFYTPLGGGNDVFKSTK